jgi:hypothetical protein
MSVLTETEIDDDLNKFPAQTSGNGNIIATGSPRCTANDGKCKNRSVPGDIFCGPHGGKLTLNNQGKLGIIGPGTYRAIASLCSLNHRYVSQVLQGKANPSLEVLDGIATVVGTDVGWLVDYISGQREANRKVTLEA